MPYKFDPRVDPEKPIDPKQPAPPFWRQVDYEREHNEWCMRKSTEYLACLAWDTDEVRRWLDLRKRGAA